MSATPALSIVVPAYNEVQTLQALAEQTVAAIEGIGCESWEIILVDDGSTDGTTELMRRLATDRPGVRAVVLRSNFGKSAALMAGFEVAAGLATPAASTAAEGRLKSQHALA